MPELNPSLPSAERIKSALKMPKSTSGTKLDRMEHATTPKFGRARTVDSLFGCVFSNGGSGASTPKRDSRSNLTCNDVNDKPPPVLKKDLLSDEDEDLSMSYSSFGSSSRRSGANRLLNLQKNLLPTTPSMSTNKPKQSSSSSKLSSLGSASSLVNGCKSVASQISKGGRKSYSFFEEMGNAAFAPRNTSGSSLSSTAPATRPSLSSQAMEGLSKLVSDGIQSVRADKEEDKEYPPDPAFFELISMNPSNPQEKQLFNESKVISYILKKPDVCKAKYDFVVGGRGNLTVSQYPLSAMVALGGSLALIRLAIKANPLALRATKSFGTTVLHTACSFDTDLEVLKCIYRKNRDAIKATTKLVYLPLHNACVRSNPSLETIEFLIDEYPQALLAINKLGDTPLRAAQRNKTVSKEVLDHLEKETHLVASLDQYQEVWKDVTDRQSWGSACSSSSRSNHSSKKSSLAEQLPALKAIKSTNDVRDLLQSSDSTQSKKYLWPTAPPLPTLKPSKSTNDARAA